MQFSLENIGFKFSLIISIFFTIRAIFLDPEKVQKIKNLFSNKGWLKQFFIIILFVIIVTKTSKDEKIVESTKKGFFAFLIALLASIDLTIAPFWFVFIFSYYTNFV